MGAAFVSSYMRYGVARKTQMSIEESWGEAVRNRGVLWARSELMRRRWRYTAAMDAATVGLLSEWLKNRASGPSLVPLAYATSIVPHRAPHNQAKPCLHIDCGKRGEDGLKTRGTQREYGEDERSGDVGAVRGASALGDTV